MSEAEECTHETDQTAMQATSQNQCADRPTARFTDTYQSDAQIRISLGITDLWISIKQFYQAIYHQVLIILTVAFKIIACSLR